jgi:outer membrane lipoprotein SlyB
METQSRPELPFRVGVFNTVAEADAAVDDLLAAGFTVPQITIVCSEEAVKRHFAEYEHQDPAGTDTPAAAVTGGIFGAALGGLVAVAGAFTMGGAALLMAGGLALWTGGVVGGLIGAMMTRGVEKELANYYDQSLTQGKILVAAEEEDPSRQAMLARAVEIFKRHGVQPVSLPES